MKRLALLCALLALQLAGAGANTTAVLDSRPNIILIIADDQRSDTLWAMPELQAVAARGTTFINAYTSTPLCCPARCSFLLGAYPHEIDVMRNSPPHGGFASCDMSYTLFVALHEQGYRVGVFGKLMNGTPNNYVPPGVDDSVIFEGNGGYYGSVFWNNGVRVVTSSATYSTDYLAEQAMEFIQATPEGQPYFVYFSPRAPHMPMTPETEDKNKFSTFMLSAPSINEDTSDKCPWMAARSPQLVSTMQTRARKQLQTLQSVDRAVGQITANVDWAKTVFVYLSDQGYFWGEHKLTEKGLPYQEALRIPLIVVIPGGAANVSNPAMVITNDLTNMIKQLAGLQLVTGWMGAPRTLTGPVIDGYGSIRESFLISQMPLFTENPPPGFIGIQNSQYKLLEWGDGCREFYDLTSDPYEMINQIGNPAYAAQIEDMLPEIVSLRDTMNSYSWTVQTIFDSPGSGGRD